MLPKSLRDLRLYTELRKFIIVVYKLTRLLPDEEKYGLISQIRRATVSILANLVEGYGRKGKKEQLHFYNISLGSFREVECYIQIIFDLQFISKEQHKYIAEFKDKVGGMLIKFIQSKK